MASVKYSALMTEIKGKIGGTVFQGGTAGKIVKNKQSTKKWSTPPQPDGPLGVQPVAGDVRTIDTYVPGCRLKTVFGGKGQRLIQQVSQAWQNLTPEQILEWNNAAPNFPFKNKFNEIYIASGFQVFMQLNLNLVNNGYLMHVFPPLYSLPNIGVPNPPLPREKDCRLQFSFDGGVPSDIAIEVYASYATTKGKKLIKGRLKQLATIFRSDEYYSNGTVKVQEVYNFTYVYESYFGIPKPNALIYFMFVPVSLSSGQKGQGIVIPVVTNGTAPSPVIEPYVDFLYYPEIGTATEWIHEFVLWSANLTSDVIVSSTDPAMSELRYSLSKNGPFMPELIIPKNQFNQTQKPQVFVKWLNVSGLPLNELIHINTAGAAEKLIQAQGTTVAPTLYLTPAAQAFGNVYLGLSSVVTSYHGVIGGNDNNDLSIGGPDAAKFKISLSPVGPWTNNIIVQPDVNGKIANAPVYVKFSPTAAVAHVAVLALNNDGLAGILQPLTGTGIAPVISPFFAFSDFGNQAIGTTVVNQFEVSALGCSADLVITKEGLHPGRYKFGLDPAMLGDEEIHLVPDEFGVIPPTIVFFSFTPVALGLKTAEFHFNSLYAAEVIQLVQGTGV